MGTRKSHTSNKCKKKNKKTRSKKKGGNRNTNNNLSKFIYEENIDMVKNALKNGADPNIHADDEFPLIISAILKGNLEIIKLLLENGADPNIHDDDDEFPLISAILKGNLEIIKLLLKNGANPNDKFHDNGVITYIVDDKINKNFDDWFEIFELFLIKGAYTDDVESVFTLLTRIMHGHGNNRKKWLELFNKYPQNININIDDGINTPLSGVISDYKPGNDGMDIINFLLNVKNLDINYSVSNAVLKYPKTALDAVNKELEDFEDVEKNQVTHKKLYKGLLSIKKEIINKGGKTGEELTIKPSNKQFTNDSKFIEKFEYIERVFEGEDDEDEYDEDGEQYEDHEDDIIRHNLSIITIPKGTVLFRKSKDLNSDYCGCRNKENPANYDVPTDLNVFFYFYPYYSDIIDATDDFWTNKMFILTQDIKLLNLTYPSSINRRDRHNTTYNNIFVSCRTHDPCFTDIFKKKHPDILGFLAIAENDANDHVKIYYNQDKTNKKTDKYPSFYSVLWEDSRIKGSPEIILYPFQKRFLKEIHHSIEECKTIGNNYKLLAESNDEKPIVSQLNDYLTPKGKNGKHITIFTPLKTFVVYEELDDNYKKSCVPLIMDVKSKLQTFQTTDLYKNDIVPFHKRDIDAETNTIFNKSIFKSNLNKSKGGKKCKKK